MGRTKVNAKGCQVYREELAAIDRPIAAGVTEWSEWFNNVEWVRHLLTTTHCDQAYDLIIQRRGSDNISDAGNSLKTFSIVTPVTTSFTPTNATGASSLLGTSARFGLKNTTANPMVKGKLNIQFLGL